MPAVDTAEPTVSRLVSRFLKAVRVVEEQRAWRQSGVLAGKGDSVLIVIEAFGAQSPGARAFALRIEVVCPIEVVRRAFPRGDGKDLNVRAPRHGPGGLLPDLNVRVPADSPGGLLPGLVVWSGGANGATQEAG